MKLIHPKAQHTRACEKCAISDLRFIRECEASVPQSRGLVRARLHGVAHNVRKARISIEQLPAREQHALRSKDILGEFSRIERESTERANKMIVRPSGGRTAGDGSWWAAQRAFDLLTDFGQDLEEVSPHGRLLSQTAVPTLSRQGRYIKLTGLLIRLATGKKERNVERACRSYVEELRDKGYPEARELRERRRQEKLGQRLPQWLIDHLDELNRR